jgi:hypothetical protein
VCRRSPTDARAGFTLLETIVGTLVLSLLAMGLARLVVGHDRLMSSMEDWLDDDPTWYVARHQDPLARTLGASATLSTTAPPATLPDPPPGRVDVTVLSIDHGLQPVTTSANVMLVDNCYYGADLAGPGEVLDSVWEVPGAPSGVTLTAGTWSEGVFSGTDVSSHDTVDVDVDTHAIAAGTYFMTTNLAALQEVRILVSGGQNDWVDGTDIGVTAAGDSVWTFDVTLAANLEQIEVSALSTSAELELRIYEDCIADEIL